MHDNALDFRVSCAEISTIDSFFKLRTIKFRLDIKCVKKYLFYIQIRKVHTINFIINFHRYIRKKLSSFAILNIIII